jgi:hypothetical protein
MQSWLAFEKDLTKWLAKASTGKLHYRNPNQAIVGYESDSFRSDGMLTDGKRLLALEVEAKQTHPDTNTGKYWLLWEKYTRYESIVLFHIFTPAFDSYGHRMDLAQFYIDKMKDQVPIEYRLLDYRKAGNYTSTLASVKAAISNKARELFGSEWKEPETTE